jgi:hypothetical protein
MAAVAVRESFTQLSCGKCCVPFKITYAMYKQRRKDQQVVYCPNGHLNRIGPAS